MAGGNINRKITITAEVAASLKGMDKVVSDFQQKLSSLKVDPTSTKAKGLTKLFGDYKAAVKDFQSYIQNGQVDPINAKDAIKSGESVIKVFKRIQDEIGDITKLDINLAKRLFPDEFSKNGKDAAKAIKEFESALNKASNKKNALYEAGQDYAKLIEKRRELSSVKTKDDFTQELNAQTEATKAAAEQLQNLIKLQAMALATGDSDVVAAKKKLSIAKGTQTKADKAMATSGLSVTTLKRQKKIADGDTFESYEAETARLKRLQSRQVNNNQLQEAKRTQEKINARTSKDNQARRYLELEYKQRKAAEAVAQRQSEYDAALANAQSAAAKRIESGDRTGLSDSDVGAIEAATQALQDQVKAQEELNQAVENAPTRKQKESAESAQDAKIAKVKENIQKIKEEFTNLSNDTDFNALFEKLQNLGISTDNIDKSREGLEQLRQQLASMDSATVERIRQRLTEMGYSAEEAEKEILGIKGALQQVEQQSDELKRVQQEIDSLTSRISSFFSIGSAINLFKRAIGDAYQAVKELDAAMTETAVVTDFSVGDMWEKLPQYTDMANQLGASVLGAYQTATRYYQQGLDTNAALAASVETMKMARIASMDYASATELLTAA